MCDLWIDLACCFVLQGTDENDKKELLSCQFSINYDTLPPIFFKGSCLMWTSSPTGRTVVVTHEDLTGESFWTKHAKILESTRSRQIQLRSNASTVKIPVHMKKFRSQVKCMPETWIVLQLDAHDFYRY